MLRVFVALGKQMPACKAMIEDTEDVAKLLAKYNCTLVQGGARCGLMGVVLTEFQKYSDEVVLIVPEVHKDDLKQTTSKESYVVEGEADRLKLTINTCDLIVVLPGGTGTMAELSYYNETCKSGEHNAKIVMVNTKGFYNKLLKFVNYQAKCGLMKKDSFKFEVIKNGKQLEKIIKELITEKQVQMKQEQIESEIEQLIAEAKEIAQMKEVKPEKKVEKTEKAKDETKKSSKAKTSTKKEIKKVVENPKTEVEVENPKKEVKVAPKTKKETKVEDVVEVKKTSSKSSKVKEETKDVKPSQKEVKTSTAKSTKTASKPVTKKATQNAEVVEDKKKTTAKTPAKKTTVSKTSKK
jgi:uncharacterized protein (TIGR00730 family)